VIAQANFPGELRNQKSGPAPFRYILPDGRSHRAQVAADHLVSRVHQRHEHAHYAGLADLELASAG
jgi:hypothetical protein